VTCFASRSNMRRLREHLKVATFSMNRTPIHHFSPQQTMLNSQQRNMTYTELLKAPTFPRQ
jgi:endonuclease I